MKSSDNQRKFEEILLKTGRSVNPKADFEKWLRENPEAAGALKSHAEKTESEKHMQFWSIIMKSPITKLAAAAAIIIAAGIFFYTTNNMTPAAYALQDTIDAYNTVSSLHIRTSRMVGQETWTTEAWLEFDMHGNANKVRFNTPNCGEPVGPLTIVGGYEYGEAWLARHNLLIVGYGNPICVIGFDVSQVEPKGLFERLSQQEELGDIILDIDVPSQKDNPILVTVTYPVGSLSENWKKVLYIDQATSLVKKIEKFELIDGEFQLKKTTEFFDYNQPIDPAMFSFEGEIPSDAIVIDMTDVEVGLLQGDMSDEEVATEITRQFFEAVIAKDYTRAGLLYSGAPAFLVEGLFTGANLFGITSIESAQPEADPDSRAFACKGKILLEFGGQYYELNLSMKIRQINTASEPNRWMIVGSSSSINPPSGGVTISKGVVDLDAVTYDNPEPGQFMKEWLVLDPIWIEVRGDTFFPVEETQKDYFETDQINTAQFEPVMIIDGKNYEWSLLESKYNTIDLTSVNENWYLVTYLYSQIDMPEEKQAILGIGSDDSVKVWLNGELVHENWTIRGTVIDNDRIPVTFKKGTNQLVIKVQNRGGLWGFCCRLLEE